MYIFPPLHLLNPTYVCAVRTCNAKDQKRSAKGSNLKEDDRALPLTEVLLYELTIWFGVSWPVGKLGLSFHPEKSGLRVAAKVCFSNLSNHRFCQLFSVINVETFWEISCFAVTFYVPATKTVSLCYPIRHSAVWTSETSWQKIPKSVFWCAWSLFIGTASNICTPVFGIENLWPTSRGHAA